VRTKSASKLDFEVDKLTNSVENQVTGDSFQTEVSIATAGDLKSVSEKNGWLFNWRTEIKSPDRDVYKLTIVGNSSVIQGLISVTVHVDHVSMNLIESAPFKKGKSKVYLGVPGNLVAFACKLSFQRKCESYVAFLAKTKLIAHYEKMLQAVHIGGQRMVINTEAALKLIDKYFPKQ